MLFVGINNVLHYPVTNHVLGAKLNEPHALDPLKDPLGPHQSAPSPRDVDLGDISSDDNLGVEPNSGQEHLHLFWGGVLSLVQDDEAVVERATTHEGQGRNFNGVLLQHLGQTLNPNHILERVVERTQVRIDLGHQISGQIAEPLARLDCWTGEQNPLDLLGLESVYRTGNRQPTFAGACRANPEGHHIGANGVDVCLLSCRLWSNRLTPIRRDHSVRQDDRRSMVRPDHLDGPLNHGALKTLSTFENQDQFLDHKSGFARGLPLDADHVASRKDLRVEIRLNHSEVLVSFSKKAEHQLIIWDLDFDSL